MKKLIMGFCIGIIVSGCHFNNPDAVQKQDSAPRDESRENSPIQNTDSQIEPYIAEDPGIWLYPARAQDEELWGFIDSKGMWVIEPRYSSASEFKNGIAFVCEGEDESEILIDKQGTHLFKIPEDMERGYSTFSDNLLCVSICNRISARYGYIDAKGNWIIEPRFTHANSFYEGLAVVQTISYNEEWDIWVPRSDYGYIDTMGNWVIRPTPLSTGSNFSCGLAVAKQDGKYGYIDRNMNWVIPPKFSEADSFCAGYAVARENGLNGVIDMKGEWVIEPSFEGSLYFTEEDIAHGVIGAEKIFAMQNNGYYYGGLIDLSGNWVVDPIFQDGLNFSGGLSFARYRVNEDDDSNAYLNGYVDINGNWAFEPRSSLAPNQFKGDLARASDIPPSLPRGEEYIEGYIDKTGNYVYSWKEKKDW